MGLSAEPIAGGETTADLIPARIADQLRLIEAVLRDAGTGAERWGQLYAAQQALCWAVNEGLAGAPYTVITTVKVQPPRGTLAG